MSAKIYHNTRCSKSRATVAILEQNDVDFEVVNYLVEPPSEIELKDILKDLGISAVSYTHLTLPTIYSV